MTGGITTQPSQLVLGSPALRLDRALVGDLRRAFTSRPLVVFLALQVAAALLFVARRGTALTSTVLLVWIGLGLVAFLCWWAGRHRLAHPWPDPVPRARARLTCALVVWVGFQLQVYGLQPTVGGSLVLAGVVAWLLVVARRDSAGTLARVLMRDPRPFLPLLLLVVVPRLLLLGPSLLLRLPPALLSGVGQQLLYLVLLVPALEAVTKRRDVAAVVAALLFASVHVPMNQPANGGDWAASIANAVFYQASVGMIACLAFFRHRAPVPLGVAHALAIA